ncbi:MAG: 50S ribosomal protein L15 [Gammaproteobacteria bacterium]|jgi:large subunit ribosomal protein L15
MQLNTLQPAIGSKQKSKRVGRGIGSGKGKTCGRGHKGQTSRAGGYHKVGFEGGQMPLQRRLPKFGFRSRKAKHTEQIRLTELARLDTEVITMEVLRSKNLIAPFTKVVKIFKDNTIDKKLVLQGLRVSAGAKAAIEKVGGKVE